MSTFVVLLFAHLLGDFPLQTNRVFKMKLANKRGLSLHVAIHLIVAIALLKDFWLHWPLLLILGVVHFVTDHVKIRTQEPGKPLTKGFIGDQVAHIVALIALAWWQPNLESVLPLWLVVIGVVFATIPAVMTLFWVWATDHYIGNGRPVTERIEWMSKKLLLISQQLGWMIMFSIFLVEMVRTFFI